VSPGVVCYHYHSVYESRHCVFPFYLWVQALCVTITILSVSTGIVSYHSTCPKKTYLGVDVCFLSLVCCKLILVLLVYLSICNWQYNYAEIHQNYLGLLTSEVSSLRNYNVFSCIGVRLIGCWIHDVWALFVNGTYFWLAHWNMS